MIRRPFMLTVALGAALVVLSGALLSPTAQAQGDPTCVIGFAPAEPTAEPENEDDAEAAESTESAESADLHADEHACAKAQAYPGPFVNRPTPAAGPYLVPSRIVAAAAPIVADPAADQSAATAAQETTDPQIAHSGSESAVLAYFGTGLVAFGAAALGTRRRYLNPD